MNITRTTLTAALAGALLALASGPVAAKSDKMAMEKMKMMDTNGDGMVSKAEHDAHGAQMFDTMDANKDGMLDMAEFKSGMEMKKDMKKQMKKDRM